MNDGQRAVVAQVVLEGVPLPAEKAALLAYARAQGAEAEVLDALGALPDGTYESLDAVGETLAPRQPSFAPPAVREPRAGSDAVPGGPFYLERPPRGALEGTAPTTRARVSG